MPGIRSVTVRWAEMLTTAGALARTAGAKLLSVTTAGVTSSSAGPVPAAVERSLVESAEAGVTTAGGDVTATGAGVGARITCGQIHAITAAMASPAATDPARKKALRLKVLVPPGVPHVQDAIIDSV